jgi:hypothetical protein
VSVPGIQDVADFILKLEGPYKWYVIGAAVAVLTALFSRFVFQTIKWFLIIVFVLAIAAVIAVYWPL